MHTTESPLNVRPPFDSLLEKIADYVENFAISSEEAYQTARYCLMDTLGCGLLALNYSACTKLLGPVVPGTRTPQGSRVPGTNFELDPVTAAFNIGALIRWLDFNDTWLAVEWGHPSDNLGGILAVADYVSRNDPSAAATPSPQAGAPGAPPRLAGTNSSVRLALGAAASPALCATGRRSPTVATGC